MERTHWKNEKCLSFLCCQSVNIEQSIQNPFRCEIDITFIHSLKLYLIVKRKKTGRMSNEEMRNALIALAMDKKNDKVQTKLSNQINTTLKNWEKILFDYVHVLTQLNLLTKLADQQYAISNIRKALRECSELVKKNSEQFEHIGELVETLLPMSTINQNWMDSIIKHDKHLGEMKDKLKSLLIFSSNREIIEIVQKLLQQINDVQAKINVLSTKVHETVDNRILAGSNQFDNLDKLDDASVDESI